MSKPKRTTRAPQQRPSFEGISPPSLKDDDKRPARSYLHHSSRAPYWDSAHSIPSALDELAELGMRGAWRIALTIPDLVAAGEADIIARLCVAWADRAVATSHPGRREMDIALDLARRAIDDELDPEGLIGHGWNLRLSCELFGMLKKLLDGSRKDRGAVFEEFGYFAVALAEAAGSEKGPLFDLMLLDISSFFHPVDDVDRPVAFADGEERHARAFFHSMQPGARS